MGFVSFITNLWTGGTTYHKLFAVSVRLSNTRLTFYFLFIQNIQVGFGTAVFILIVAILFQCGAEAASVESRCHINDNTLLAGQDMSPFMPESGITPAIH